MEIIYEDKSNNLKITIDQSYNHTFLEFARDIVYGTNGVISKMNSVEIEFKKFTHFVSLTENDELIGICLYKSKQIHQNNCTFNAFYRSFLSIHPGKMNKGYGTLLATKTTDYFFAQFEKVIIYIYVNDSNARIRRVAQKADYSQLATFLLVSHICLVPKQNQHTTKLDQNDMSKMLSLLNHQYTNHSFVDINESFDAKSYYVLKENNEIKAGVQVKILSYTFEKFPGLYGFLLMKIIPKIPILKKVFNPKNHMFLKVGNIYASDSKSLRKLLDAVLYLYDFRTCVACLNPNSNVDSTMIDTMKKGILSSITGKHYMLFNSKNVNLHELGVNSANCFYSNF
jgi:hypothetical protein